ncbi:M15 family metallopeptidase [Methylobacterium trifolii]|uniref:D-alanyl-D-alanine dipeptidase n=1 Tax=Methylobacterium trifolii TaxID=1003092 RepID=A0ABQ4TVU7_9HYPH|nr:M15 family metallopeptidase [Methylobacterium trifolii]GJE59186.1 D-alanyl-D-alanine dipeptidase [Methylobacterium trifolii]
MRRRLSASGPLLALGALPALAGPAPDFVDAGRAVAGLVVEMRYAGADNFLGRPVAGYEAPVCLLARPAARALAQAQAALARAGYGLKVFDCYRPARAVADFVRWARDPRDQAAKAEYYPDVDKGDLFRLGYVAARSGHSRGATVDLTLVDVQTGREVAMGTPFDRFDPRSGAGAAISPEARANRERLAAAMRRAGFAGYAREWWHFSLRNEPYPATTFDVPVRAP